LCWRPCPDRAIARMRPAPRAGPWIPARPSGWRPASPISSELLPELVRLRTVPSQDLAELGNGITAHLQHVPLVGGRGHGRQSRRFLEGSVDHRPGGRNAIEEPGVGGFGGLVDARLDRRLLEMPAREAFTG